MPRHIRPAVIRIFCLCVALALAAAFFSAYAPGAPATSSSARTLAFPQPAQWDTTTAPAAAAHPAASLTLGQYIGFHRAASVAPLVELSDLGDLDAGDVPSATTNLTASLPLTVDVATLPAAAITATLPVTLDAGIAGVSTLERAHARLQAEGLQTQLIVVSPSSQGVALAIYRDLRARYYRSTTGPDEGIDTHSLACYPACVFVPVQSINVLSVDRWAAVLRHEYRHVIQAGSNPNMASDFRGADRIFTSYGLFSEVCADYGIYVAPGYGARWRMGALKARLGASLQPLIDQACRGSKPSYDTLVQTYNRVRRSSRAFAALFPRYR